MSKKVDRYRSFLCGNIWYVNEGWNLRILNSLVGCKYMNNRLQELRWEKDWSQEKLSRQSGVPRTTISAIESGTTTNPSTETALLLSKALGIPVEDIFIL